ncbi:YfbM family protein [Embleya sp. NPDC020886]|uniref:YfbM family protein n=1 Tax=Embleya sp. NPDC020886 TaxID=3363980 RepID=UPI0037AC1B7B
MGMVGEYLRVAPAELARAITDQAWGEEFIDDVLDAESEGCPDPTRARSHNTDKAWDALGFLTRRIGFTVDVVHGAEAMPWDENDWSHGVPRYLTPDRVRAAAEALSATPGHRLVAGVGPADLVRAGVYPAFVWEQAESLEYATGHYAALGVFFRSAAEAGDAVLVWLS